MTISEAVIKRIYELCDERKLTINKLCYISGVTQSTVSNIINRNNSATIATIKKLCDGLDIHIRDFFASEIFDSLEQEVK